MSVDGLFMVLTRPGLLRLAYDINWSSLTAVRQGSLTAFVDGPLVALTHPGLFDFVYV